MKIVVIGGSGLIGSKVVAKLRAAGHEAVPASPSSGVNTLTGEGLAEVLVGASVVVDVSNSPSFADGPVMEFFLKSTGNLLKYEAAAGVSHHVALSVVGTDRLPESGYFRAKLAQENLIQESPIPYTIVRATQFFEFVGAIAASGQVPVASIQPIAAEDVATLTVKSVLAPPVKGIIEIGGPRKYRFDELLGVNADPQATYFGAPLQEDTLVAGEEAELGSIRYEDWLNRASLAGAITQ